ncbi:hypothetical protein [Actinokineospora fastidiosa]|uniref:Uncharacterized protein n=1 Tax=Actinokineospora fastidiosa TaxID=1816 RepID=A0A918LJ52_9PSEU|nr:hypothetical protein [Actinokineospora fastidiosa]GGS58880.1 hypothetical protein GCM10010171_62310 [Actinokineospora fastidiosa]
MNQPDDRSREVSAARATLTGARIALIGTIIAALIGATATITAALVQHDKPDPTAVPAPTTRAPTSTSEQPPSTAESPTSTSGGPTGTTTTASDGVTYRCTGSAPHGIAISYGSSTSGLQATGLPFTAQESSVSRTARYYSIRAQLHGGGEVTCTLTVTAAGRTTTSTGTARGGYNQATPQVCADYERRWTACG